MARRRVGGHGTATVNLKPFLKFYEGLQENFDHFVATKAVVGQWADETGHGLYTAAGARAGIILIRNIIDQKKIIPGLKMRSAGSAHSGTFPEVASYNKPWKYTGNVYKNVYARKSGKGYEIGIKKRPKVSITGFRTLVKGGRTVRSMPVHQYAAYVEYGTKYQDPMPLFGPALKYWSSTVDPSLFKVVRDSVDRIANKYKMKRDYGVHATGEAGAFLSEHSMQSANPNKDFDSRKFEGRSQLADSGFQVTKFSSSTGRANVKKNVAKDVKMVKQAIERTCGPLGMTDEVRSWIDKMGDIDLPTLD